METCDYPGCGAEMVEKSRGEGFIVIACRRGHSCYRCLDEKTGKPIQEKAAAVLREIQSNAHHVVRQSAAQAAAQTQNCSPRNIHLVNTDSVATVGG